MTTVKYGHVIFLGHSVNRAEKRQEVLLRVNVLFPMRGKQDVFTFLEMQSLVNIAGLYFGHGLIQLRKIGTEEVVSFEVSGGRMEVVEMIPGYTHNIVNLSETEDLVTFMWCNECFDPARPDTYFEKV